MGKEQVSDMLIDKIGTCSGHFMTSQGQVNDKLVKSQGQEGQGHVRHIQGHVWDLLVTSYGHVRDMIEKSLGQVKEM